MKCLCISTKTQFSDTITTSNVQNNDALTLKNNYTLEVIYEDIEYRSITDLQLYKL